MQGLPLPPVAAPGQAPPGWDPGAEPAVVYMEGHACNRLAAGPLERPLRLVLDAHNRAEVPAGCHADSDNAQLFVLHALWTDDAEAAGYLARTFGLPARPTPIAPETQALGAAGRLHTWTWGDPQAPSTLRVEDPDLPWSLQRHLRLFWLHGDGLGMLDLDYTFHDSPHAWRPAQGTLAPPMLLGGTAGGALLGTAGWLPSFAVTGTFTFYRDRACAEPEAGP